MCDVMLGQDGKQNNKNWHLFTTLKFLQLYHKDLYAMFEILSLFYQRDEKQVHCILSTKLTANQL